MPNPGQIAAIQRPKADPFLALFQVGDSWFDADNVNTASGQTVEFIDVIDPTHFLTQATSSNRAASPATDALFAGANCVLFDGSNDYYLSNRPTSAWTYLHDGSGCTIFAVFEKVSAAAFSHVIWSTWTNTGTGGFWHYGPDGYWSVKTTGLGAIADTADPSVGATYTEAQFASSLAPTELRGRIKNGSAATSTPNGSLYATAPARSLTLGCLFPGANHYAGKFRALYCFKRILTTPERAIVQSKIQTQTGITP